LPDVRQSLLRSLGERAVAFGVSQWPVLPDRRCLA
jgi:hypothetical protein